MDHNICTCASDHGILVNIPFLGQYLISHHEGPQQIDYDGHITIKYILRGSHHIHFLLFDDEVQRRLKI